MRSEPTAESLALFADISRDFFFDHMVGMDGGLKAA